MLLILLALLVYSALVIWSASGQDIGMMERKIGQIAMGLVVMVVMAQIPPRVYEGWAPYLYIICIILLVAVDAFGAISKGAQRWLDLGIVRFQPSEIAKIAVPLMVARFINRDVCPPSLKNTAIALVLIFMPTLLVAAQPDLGTSILVALSGLFVLFLSGLSWRLIGVAIVLIAAFIPILWFFLMHDYQRQRVMMLLDPETDPRARAIILFSLKSPLAQAACAVKAGSTAPSRSWSFYPNAIPTLFSRYWRKSSVWWAS